MKYFGDTCDIHIAGRELLFPMHENEIAIAGALHKKPLARFWLHCDRVLADGKKVDAQENSLTVKALVKSGWSGREIRFWLLCNHYRKPVVFTDQRLLSARRTLQRLDDCVATLQQVQGGRPYSEMDQLIYDLKNGFVAAMDDDFNISVALAGIFRAIKQLNRLVAEDRIAVDQVSKVLDGLKNIDAVLGIFNFDPIYEDPHVRTLLQQRAAARLERNWDLADGLRKKLADLGVMVRDAKV
jgi:cysteinyl-tRNA synthetase